MHNNTQNNDWISISDIMTGLMVIFLFITVSYMVEANKKENEIKLLIDDFENTTDSIGFELEEILQSDLNEWSDYVRFDKDKLSIKFVGKNIQFEGNSDRIRSKFIEILDDFIPKYLEVIQKEKYADKIGEIRIEGHANKVFQKYSERNYLYGVDLSQRRAKSVLDYFINHNQFKSLPEEDKYRLHFWLVANGYGFGRTLDDEGNFTRYSGGAVCEECSRRVEFRIITKSEQVIADLVTQLQSR